MRDIKFRVFHQREKKMYPVKVLEMFSEGDWRVTIVGLTDKLGMYITSDRGELMQYTGIKDKNGVEIYEGDIMDGYAGRQQVIWSEDVGIGFGFCWEPIEKNTESITGFIDEYEVIGNIYENPELINSPETL